MTNDDEEIHVTTNDARAGSTNNVTRYVLGFSLVLVVIVFAVILLIGET